MAELRKTVNVKKLKKYESANTDSGYNNSKTNGKTTAGVRLKIWYGKACLYGLPHHQFLTTMVKPIVFRRMQAAEKSSPEEYKAARKDIEVSALSDKW